MQKTFTFNSLPHNVAELQQLPEASLTDPFATAALVILGYCEFRNSKENCYDMIEFLNGPYTLTPMAKSFIKDRLDYGNDYVPYSYFDGATPQNDYTVPAPFSITVYDNPYSYNEENYARLLVRSGGADNLRFISLRKKPSTGQWFLFEAQILGGIRIPVSKDAWA